MNKKSIALFVGAITALTVTHAQTATPAPAPTVPSVSVAVTPAIVSQYMFRGQRLGGPSFQPVVEVAYGNLGVGVWANFPIKDKVVGVSDPEIDPYFYYTVTINDSLSIVPGATYYAYPDADTSAGFYRSTFEPSLALNYTVNGFKITPKVYYDTVLEGPTGEITGAYAVPLKDLGMELDFVGTYGGYSQKDVAKGVTPKIKATGNYWLVGVSAPFQVSKASKLVVGFAYTKGGDASFEQAGVKFDNPLAVGRGVASISYSFSF